jgi:hypothetical protein
MLYQLSYVRATAFYPGPMRFPCRRAAPLA